MARYFPSNTKFAANSMEFFDDLDYGKMAESTALQDAYSNAEYLMAGANAIGGALDGQYNVINAQGQGQRQEANASAGILPGIISGGLRGAAGPLANYFAPNPGGGAGDIFSDLSSSDTLTSDPTLSQSWRDAGGVTYWDSDMPIDSSALRY